MNANSEPVKKKSDLPTRVVTALVLAAVVIGVLASGSVMFWTGLVAVFCLLAAWEASRLADLTNTVSVASDNDIGIESNQLNLLNVVFLGALFGIVFISIYVPDGNHSQRICGFLLGAVAVFWCVIAPWQLVQKHAPVDRLLMRFVLALVITVAFIAAVLLFRLGVWFLVAAVVLTVIADVAAYFFGRAFGRVKLAPAISPGKSREGAYAGLLFAGAWAAFAAWYLQVATTLPAVALAFFVGTLLGALSIVGDLWESLLKRQAGVKDSSALLPGHGGVLDRIDAHLAVLPVTALILLFLWPFWKS